MTRYVCDICGSDGHDVEREYGCCRTKSGCFLNADMCKKCQVLFDKMAKEVEKYSKVCMNLFMKDAIRQ